MSTEGAGKTDERDRAECVYDCVVVGGGIHGVSVANRLLAAGLEPERLAIVDPHERLLESFRSNARACGMETLRSSYVHHLGLEAFGLERFALDRERTDELVATVDYPPRPTLALFLDHAEAVITSCGLSALHRRATVERIDERDGRLELRTAAGRLIARTCVLAVGNGRLRQPAWAEGVDAVTHVWGEFDPGTAGDDETIIVGGGITAAHLACSLEGALTLLSRHPLSWELAEADPYWINWPYIDAQLHKDPPASRARYETATAARNDATVPPYLYQELEERLGDALVTETGTVEELTRNGTEITLHLERGRRLTADRVVLATGFEPAFEHPFVETVSGALGLDRGYRRLPVLDDDTLAWRREDGSLAPVFVTGALALGTVGPLAPTIVGARRASERIAETIVRRVSEPSTIAEL